MAALGRRAFSSGKSVSAYWCALGALCRSEASPGIFCLRGGSPASLRAGSARGCALKHPKILSVHDIGANKGGPATSLPNCCRGRRCVKNSVLGLSQHAAPPSMPPGGRCAVDHLHRCRLSVYRPTVVCPSGPQFGGNKFARCGSFFRTWSELDEAEPGRP